MIPPLDGAPIRATNGQPYTPGFIFELLERARVAVAQPTIGPEPLNEARIIGDAPQLFVRRDLEALNRASKFLN
jgi:hypothetical protein